MAAPSQKLPSERRRDADIRVLPEQPADTALTAQDIPLDVVYEDDDVIVVNKPAGLVVHPAPATRTARW